MRPHVVFHTEPTYRERKKSARTDHKIEKPKESPSIPRTVALTVGATIIFKIREADSSVRVSFAGSIRREVEEIHDIDILVCPPSKLVLNRISQLGEVLWSGAEKISILYADSGLPSMRIQVDVRFIEPESWGPALQYFTGSREHNISLRTLAKLKGLSLNEHGLFDSTGMRIDDGSEGSVYKSLGLRWLPPRYRNGYIGRFKGNSRSPHQEKQTA